MGNETTRGYFDKKEIEKRIIEDEIEAQKNFIISIQNSKTQEQASERD